MCIRDRLRSFLLVVLVGCQQPSSAAVVSKEGRAVAGILGGHPGHLPENFDRPLRHVAKMPERGRNYI